MKLYIDKQKFEDALHCGKQSFYVDVLDPVIHQQLAETAVKLNQSELAVRELKIVLHLDEKNEDMRFLLAKTLFDSGKKEEALTQLDLLLQQNPGHAKAIDLKKKR